MCIWTRPEEDQTHMIEIPSIKLPLCWKCLHSPKIVSKVFNILKITCYSTFVLGYLVLVKIESNVMFWEWMITRTFRGNVGDKNVNISCSQYSQKNGWGSPSMALDRALIVGWLQFCIVLRIFLSIKTCFSTEFKYKAVPCRGVIKGTISQPTGLHKLTCERTLTPVVLRDRSAKEERIFLWVKLSVECGLKDSLVLKTAWPCRPVPCLMNRWLWSPWNEKEHIWEWGVLVVSRWC